ncbi:hypothetical protein [Pseudosulfitobacter pseudonitzschiae]|uniref:hypothetical protein n=1 Tax=Pseudosulfitobacter pseudonitzschiae TaxID=1402135 RepID=UPI001AFAA428|nr:hypothetical protein [Pseudosulfitobacter pseudonitzschiae]MBM1816487.1 hypothetical protein [Pseudosulfitobacter pseudonitzschiae]MBM1833085.1 hypothetical protein [Pseudosulfitobacter pseudonitzschiae]MBM1837953.1 hypothetical protein [Pseudosulfitobacter pseudonitzschiae]MBM1843214.1 hypothetical protein [Pseudosulfitobacter pseudonitzschiae]MBM1848080.1 hypothetical protein [Pseudosulfitobacter pseudonitzschiae]
MSETLASAWESLTPIYDDLTGLAFTLLAGIIVYFFRSRVKLTYGTANNSLNTISVPSADESSPPTLTEIYTEKFFLKNDGRKPATNVEFVLSDFPADISVWEPRQAKYERIQKGNCLISIPQIAPDELVIIDCVYLNQRAAFVASVKCAECIGKEVPFWVTRRFPGWFNWTAAILMLFGVAFIFQIVLKLTGS